MVTEAYLRQAPDRRDNRSRLELVLRIRTEFEELPAHRLTSAQLRRLFGLRGDVCERVIAALVEGGVLSPCPDGRYALNADAGTVSRDATGQQIRSESAGREENDATP